MSRGMPRLSSAHNATQMPLILSFLLRVLLLAAGLVFAASVLAAFALLLALVVGARAVGAPHRPAGHALRDAHGPGVRVRRP